MPSDASPSLVRLHGLERSDRVQTYAELNDKVQRVKSALEAAGFKCPPTSALGSLFQKAHLLNEQWENDTNEQDIQTLMKADDAARIAAAVDQVLGDPAATEAIRRITKSDMNLSTTRQPSSGKDALWELDLLTFLRGRAVPVRMQEPPDLAVTLPSSLGAYGIACKKVYSESSVEKQLKKGCDQLRSMGAPGIVAFNLDDLAPAKSLLVRPTRAEATDLLYRRNIAFVGRHRRRFSDAVKGRKCDGVLLATAVQGDIANLSPRFNRITEYTVWTIDDAELAAQRRLVALRDLIESLRV